MHSWNIEKMIIQWLWVETSKLMIPRYFWAQPEPNPIKYLSKLLFVCSINIQCFKSSHARAESNGKSINILPIFVHILMKKWINMVVYSSYPPELRFSKSSQYFKSKSALEFFLLFIGLDMKHCMYMILEVYSSLVVWKCNLSPLA